MDGFKIKYKDLLDLLEEFKLNLESVIGELESFENKLTTFVNIDKEWFDGEGAEAVKTYFNDVHISMICALKVAAQSLLDDMAMYKYSFLEVDYSTNFVLNKEVIEEYQKKITGFAESVYTDDGNELSPENAIIKALSTVSDYYDGSYPSDIAEAIISCHEELNNTMTTLIEKTEELEETTISLVENKTDVLISQIEGVTNTIGTDWDGMKNYVADSFYSDQNVNELMYSCEYAYTFRNNIEEFYNSIWETEEQLADAAEQREEEGMWKTIGGITLAVTGTLCIVCTCGAATPIVATTGTIAGGGCILFGTADVSEGIQDMEYGSQGDTSSTSFNYMKSVVYSFGGNDEIYYKIENAFANVASALVPIGRASTAGKLTFRTTASIIGQEVASNEVGELASNITYNCTENRTLSMLAGMAGSNLTSSGMNKLSSKMASFKGTKMDDLNGTPDTLLKNCDDIETKKLPSEGPYADVETQKTTQGQLIDDRVPDGQNTKGMGVPNESGLNSADDIIRDGSQLENGKLKPNVKYQTGEHEYIYQTNEDGLISHASTDNLQIKTHEGRLNHNSNTYGKEVGDHAGHIFGDRFGGLPELDNLVSQAQRVNQSEFKIIENEWAKALENGQKVTVDIDINYASSSSRPTSFDVSYTIDDIPFFKHIEN